MLIRRIPNNYKLVYKGTLGISGTVVGGRQSDIIHDADKQNLREVTQSVCTGITINKSVYKLAQTSVAAPIRPCHGTYCDIA